MEAENQTAEDNEDQEKETSAPETNEAEGEGKV